VLAGDYGNGDWFVGTMESANKSGRLAANEILDRAGSRQEPAAIFEHYHPPEWEPFKNIDEQRYAQGQPNLFDTDMTQQHLTRLLRQIGQGLPATSH
jgi:hypothetical protein